MKMDSESGDAALEFLKLLLRRCQQEFLKDINDDEAFMSKQKELDAAQNQDERQRLESELEAMKTKAHRRCLGLIRFVSELFKLQMLRNIIVHECIYKLLDYCVEESFECLCKLLPTCGKQLDTEEAKPRMDQYFSYIDYIIQEGEVSCRVKFLLKGLVELRLNNWVPQGPENGPRTIRKIHQEQVRKKGELIHVQRRGEGEAHRAAYDANSWRKAPESSWRSEHLHLTDVNEAAPQMSSDVGSLRVCD
ncbi:eukaryotic translation initiation factor 4 gamma 3-like [Takifugu rubripes]|uniref:eukaryotic translation initiation factor 4 gamma 3-like n=1 Tax=Takifugu rubripes TaxID=31033 RepID=UPI00114577FE|nr:eukaryotic translation initiation factor 4 gamma 3-like [Takifugu rubripes]